MGRQKEADSRLLQHLPQNSVVVPVQVLGELFHVLVRKAGRSPSKSRSAILSWQDAFSVVETSVTVMLAATDLATDHRLSIWDAVIFSGAAEVGCRLLLSEDLHDGLRRTALRSAIRSPMPPIRCSERCC